MTFVFGDDSDPEAIPVRLVEASVQVPSYRLDGRRTGHNRYTLDRLGANIAEYNAVTGLLDTHFAQPFEMRLTNRIVQNEPVVYFMSGAIDSETGHMTVQYQAAHLAPARR